MKFYIAKLIGFLFFTIAMPQICHAAKLGCNFLMQSWSTKPVDAFVEPSGFLGRDFHNLWATSNLKNSIEQQMQEILYFTRALNSAKKQEVQLRLRTAARSMSNIYTQSVRDRIKILEIALAGEPALQNWVRDLLRAGAIREEIRIVGHLVLLSSDQLKERISASISSGYFFATKASSSAALPPRRSVAYLLKIAMGWPRIFVETARTKGVRLALEDYFLSTTGFARTIGRSYGKYSLDDVLNVALDIQQAMRMRISAESIDKKNRDQEPFVLLDGSFANGFADISFSDIDLFFTHPALAGLTKDLKTFRNFRYEDVNQIIDPRVSREGLDNILGELWTMAFRVKLNSIEVLVFPAGRTTTTESPVVYQIKKKDLPLLH